MFSNRRRSAQHYRLTNFKHLDAMFVGILLRDSVRDLNVEIESSRHREVFEISSRAVQKL